MFTCQTPMVGKSVGSKVLVVRWTTHSLVADNPPNDPQYSMGASGRKFLVGTDRSPLG